LLVGRDANPDRAFLSAIQAVPIEVPIVFGSIQIGRILGIPLRVHVTFLILVLVIGVGGYLAGGREQGPAQALWSMLFIVAIFACVVLHELAHSLVARSYGVRVESITLLPIGGVAAMEEMPRAPREEGLMAIAGPLMSLAIAGALYGVIHLLHYAGPTTFVGGPWLQMLFEANLIIAGFNLLPAFPMDGGRVLRAVLASRMDHVEATNIATSVGQVMAVLIGLAGLFVFHGNLWLLVIAIFIFVGAGQEGKQVRVQAVLERITAGQAMATRFETLPRDATLGVALAYATQGYQHDFPVVEGDTIVGIVTRQDLLTGLHHLGAQHTVGEVMSTNVCQVPPGANMADVYRRLAQGACGVILVREADRIIGLVTPESFREQLLAANGGPR
jgi:stage IV sporulation protein FB